jgi:hypothetical protein
MVWLAPAKAEHLALGEKRIAGCSEPEARRDRTGGHAPAKNLGLDLPAALGKHVLGGSRQVGMSATQAFVPCNFPPQPPDQICGTALVVSLFLA